MYSKKKKIHVRRAQFPEVHPWAVFRYLCSEAPKHRSFAVVLSFSFFPSFLSTSTHVRLLILSSGARAFRYSRGQCESSPLLPLLPFSLLPSILLSCAPLLIPRSFFAFARVSDYFLRLPPHQFPNSFWTLFALAAFFPCVA